jgi:ubiquinone/menaquinone biosynthesis C-methylase UbiE
MSLFDQIASSYDLWYEDQVGKMVDKLENSLVFKHLMSDKGSLILDAGCGTGIYSRRLAKKGNYVIGIDASEKMLHIAQNKPAYEGPVIEYIKGDLHYLPFKNNLFDSVICITALEFCRDACQVILELGRVLKPHGQLILGMLNKESSWMQEITSRPQSSSIYSHAHLFSPTELKELLNDSKLYMSISLESTVFFTPSQGLSRFPSVLINELKGKLSKPLQGGFFVCSTRKKV